MKTESKIVTGGLDGIVNVINAMTLKITQTFYLDCYYIKEIKKTSKEWVFATNKGI